MPRVRWCPLPVLCLLGVYSFWIVQVQADCWYDDEKHEEGTEVATAEPCLNCTCSRGALLCYLRVCPKLPNPPPPGCILLHRYRTCCSELICTDMPNEGNGLEARSEPDGIDIPYDRTILTNACVANGSIYGPGSAMDSSSICEYCYCLGGKQVCVKPKCLLPIEGCTPMYEPSNCCPVHYNCTSLNLFEIIKTTTSSTTTNNPSQLQALGGCLVGGKHYFEGGKVLGVGHSVCDNCYCLRGILRCEPLSCAPPLLGCTPVVKPGDCCAASYNCSGTIEISPEPNYGHFPTVSKEYAKLRKEVQQKLPTKKINTKESATENSNVPFYVTAQSQTATTKNNQRSPGTFGTTRHFAGVASNPSTSQPFYYSSMIQESLFPSENKHSTRSYPERKFPGVYFATTNYEFQNTNYKRPFSTTNKPTEQTTTGSVNSITTTDYNEEKLRSTDYLVELQDESIFSIVDSLLDGRLNRKVENDTNEVTTEESGETTTDLLDKPTTFLVEEDTTKHLVETTAYDSFTETVSTTEILPTTLEPMVNNNSYPVTLKTVKNSTDCSNGNDEDEKWESNTIVEVTTLLPVDANEINKLADFKSFDEELLTTTDEEAFSTELTTEEDVTEVDLESRVKVSSVTLRNVPNIPPDIEAILNISKSKDNDYEFDYNEPSLPPSLPNVRIIPFVAADALDSKKHVIKNKADIDIYPQERIQDPEFGYTNLFSPPQETEGGFVPKDPPILENFYENAVTVPSITIAPINSNNVNCISEGHDIVNGQPVLSESPCITCNCFYGNIICQKPPCPVPRPNCRKSTVQDLTLCCPLYICDDEEAPTVVLDRHEGLSKVQEVVTVADGVVTPDPFRDVIRTEPAPNLQELFGDRKPFFTKKTTSHLQVVTTENPISIPPVNNTTNLGEAEDNDGFSFDKVLQLLFAGDAKKETSTHQIQNQGAMEMTGVIERVTTTVAPSVGHTAKLPDLLVNSEQRENENLNNDIISNSHKINSTPGVGLLKLAGCNIYGRMYRVGRIISELSGPCLECKCTEIGVQCKALKC